jgi:GNAT superfamily N-acetyltransferase
MSIEIAQEHEIGTVLALVEDLLAELGEEGQEFAGIDRRKLRADIERNMGTEPGSGRFLALLAKDASGAVVGVLTLTESFALYAGGEYGVIEEMYVRPEFRCQGVGRQLVDEAVAIARQRRWFRLDVTGPAKTGLGHVGPADDPRACCRDARGASARVVRFYEKMGFEFVGPKLRLVIDTSGMGALRL